MRRFFLVLVLAIGLGSSLSLISQDHSLSKRVDSLLFVADEFARKDTLLSLRAASQVLEISKSQNYPEGIIKAFLRKGNTYYFAGLYKKAYIQYGLSAEASLQYNRPTDQFKAIGNQGLVLHRQGKYSEAIKKYHKAEAYYASAEMNKEYANTLKKLGNSFRSAGMWDKALESYFGALGIHLENQDSSAMADSYLGIGNVYAEYEQWDSASQYYQKSIVIHTALENLPRLASLHTNLGNLALEQDSLDVALDQYAKALKFQQSLNQPYKLALLKNNLGNAYYEKGIKIKDKAYLEKANLLLSEALHESVRLETEQLEIYIRGSLYKNSLAMGDSILALRYHLRFDTLQEKQFQEQKLKIKDLEIEQAHILSTQQAQQINFQKSQRNALIGLALLLVLLLGGAAWSYQQKQRDNKKLAEQKTEIVQREQEKSLLLRELHHRVKNNLQLVSSLLNLQSYQLKDAEAAHAVKEGQGRVEAMAIIHRDLYLTEKLTEVNIKGYLEKLVGNVSQAFGNDNVQLTQHIEDLEVDVEKAIPLALIVNELITNVFKHAFNQHPNPVLSLTAQKRANGDLLLEIADNGPGMDPDTLQQDSFGMEMIRSLVKQLKAKLSIINENGCKTQVILPNFQEKIIHHE